MLKRHLADVHGDDRDGYSDAKTDFIEAALKEASAAKMRGDPTSSGR
jgi:GrpB-like predicted nucleotidyltransferase (UPF0157 family)